MSLQRGCELKQKDPKINIFDQVQVGQRFGSRVVKSYAYRSKDYMHFFTCVCDCGGEDVVGHRRLLSGEADQCRSCANTLRRKHPPVEVGNSYGYWTVVDLADQQSDFVRCRCNCGLVKEVNLRSLQYGQSTKCYKCARREGATTHGEGRTYLYQAWCRIKGVTSKPSYPNYASYGGRGIKMHRPWLDSYEVFKGDVGPRPSKKHSLDRIDNDGHYEPQNVRWATPTEQVRNRSVSFKVDGSFVDVRGLARKHKIGVRTIRKLINAGYSLYQGAVKPVRSRTGCKAPAFA